jgi:C-terminal processing protease CtpA/Prc
MACAATSPTSTETDSTYAPVSIIYPLSADTDVGDVGIAKARVKRTDPHGELGIAWTDFPEDTPSAQRAFQVAAIDPAGPAAATDLRVGDIITTIDGVDARNNNRSAAWGLLDGAPGTVVTLGTARGVTVAITLAKQ